MMENDQQISGSRFYQRNPSTIPFENSLFVVLESHFSGDSPDHLWVPSAAISGWLYIYSSEGKQTVKSGCLGEKE